MASNLTSDLCKPLPLMLSDQSAVSSLDYFVQFLEAQQATHLLQFWLSVEAFKATPHSHLITSCEVEGGGHEIAEPVMNVNCSQSITPGDVQCNGTQATTAVSALLLDTCLNSLSDNHLAVPLPPVAHDAIEIYTSYIALNALTPVDVPADVRQRIEVNICPEDGIVDLLCFREAQDYVYHKLESSYYPAFLRSIYFCRYQLEYISSGQLSLLDFLLADNALFYFMEYMETEGASSLVQFWLMAHNFHQHLTNPQHTPHLEQDTQDAIVIYDRFFSLQASQPLSMEDSVRVDIENRICSEHGPSPDSYSLAQDQVYQTMSQNFYPNFLRSSIYLRFLNEIVSILNSTSSSGCGEPLPPGSANRPHSISRQVPEWRDDLDDPDTLWHRPHLPLRLGYVDQFGKYISEVDFSTRDGSSSKSGRFAWIINKREQEEELTMRIAVNIVSEVIELTRLRTSQSHFS